MVVGKHRAAMEIQRLWSCEAFAIHDHDSRRHSTWPERICSNGVLTDTETFSGSLLRRWNVFDRVYGVFGFNISFKKRLST